jgi:hypothetical protein
MLNRDGFCNRFGQKVTVNRSLNRGGCWRWITSTIYSWINTRNGTNEIIYIGLGFKLINFTSFGEFMFSTGLFQKTTKRDIFVKGKIWNENTAYTREDSRRHEKTPERSGRREATKWGRPAPLKGQVWFW